MQALVLDLSTFKKLINSGNSWQPHHSFPVNDDHKVISHQSQWQPYRNAGWKCRWGTKTQNWRLSIQGVGKLAQKDSPTHPLLGKIKRFHSWLPAFLNSPLSPSIFSKALRNILCLRSFTLLFNLAAIINSTLRKWKAKVVYRLFIIYFRLEMSVFDYTFLAGSKRET